MADRRVRVILEAQADQYRRGMEQAAQATERLSDSADRAGRSAQGVTDPIREIGSEWSNAARNMQSEMQTVGAGFAAVGGAITAFTGGLVATGVEYNTLQQVAGRAMETMTGSAADAAEQMDRLHEFADTSPFARQVWIEAQQQLMAFGMEAERVVPTLDGIQNAVAAIGGGETEVARLVDILGQIEGQGRITGRELQRMGQMGINAADIIGEAMGVSGNEIREQITAGSLDAETAITALTDGMQMRFGGAAEGLRETMTGATDRVKAAWRDLGAVLAEPLVSAEGGGLLVDLTNGTADFLRVVQQLPDPVLQTTGAIAGIGGAAMLGYGGMMMLLPQVVAFRDAKARLAEEMPRTTAAMRGFNRALGGVAVAAVGLSALDALWESMRPAARSVEEVTTSLESFHTTGVRTEGIVNFGAALNEMDTIGGRIATNAPGWTSALMTAFSPSGGMNLELLNMTNEELERTDEALAGMVSSGSWEAVASNVRDLAEGFKENERPLSQLRQDFPELDAALRASGTSMEELLVAVGASKGIFDEATGTYRESEITLSDLLARLTDMEAAQLEAADGSVELAGTLAEVGLAADGTIESLRSFMDVLFETGLLTQSVMEAESAFEAQLDAVDESVQSLTESLAEDYEAKGYSREAAMDLAREQVELGHALDDTGAAFDNTTQDGRDAEAMFFGVADRGRDLTSALAENGATQAEVQGSLRSTYDSLIETGIGFGMTRGDAEALTREVLGIPDNADIDSWMDDEAKRVAEETKRALDEIDGRRTTSSHVHTINTRRIGSTGTSTPTGGRLSNTIYNSGGAVYGPGTGTSDSIAAWLSKGEHVIPAREVELMGGHQAVYQFRSRVRNGSQQPRGRDMVPAYAAGGAVGPVGAGGGAMTAEASLVGAQVEIGTDGLGRFVDGRVKVSMKDPTVVRAGRQAFQSQDRRDRRAG